VPFSLASRRPEVTRPCVFDTGFTLETREAIAILGEGLRQYFVRNVATPLPVARAKHFAHAA